MPWAGDLEPHAVRHTLGCLLARAQGRSPLEYLDAAGRDRQRDAGLALIGCPPVQVDDLAGEWLARLEALCP